MDKTRITHGYDADKGANASPGWCPPRWLRTARATATSGSWGGIRQGSHKDHTRITQGSHKDMTNDCVQTVIR